MSLDDAPRLLRLPLLVEADAQRLDVSAPRLAWAGESQRRLWAPRLAAIRAALLDIEFDDVAAGRVATTALECAPVQIAPLTARLRSLDLAAIPLGARVETGPATEDAPVPHYRLALTRRDGIDALVDALASGDLAASLRLAGYPDCCGAALTTALASGERLPLAIHAAGSARTSGGSRSSEACGLLQSLGLAAVPHIACSDRCAASRTLGAARLARGRAAGHDAAMGWLAEALAWPMRYSRRNGIAELHTPVLRLLADAGSRQPRLDYAPSGPSPRVPGADVTFVETTLDGEFDNPAAADYGFDSVHAWRTRQAEVVWEQSRRLRAAGGSLLDLACGDGYLLQLAEAETRRLQVFGLDTRHDQVARARRRLSHRADALAVGGPTRLRDGLAGCPVPVDVALLRPEDVVDLAATERAALLDSIFAAARCVIAYASDRALRRHGTLAQLLAAAGLVAETAPAAADISVVACRAG